MLAELYRTTIHSVISVFGLFILTRIMGKKQIAQLSFFDYTIGISIGSIAAQTAVDPAVHFTEGLAGLIIFTLFSVLLSWISIKSNPGRKLLDGSPTVLIENGKIIESGLKKNKLTVNDLLEECRQKNVFDLSDIEFAVLETSGKLSILFKASKQPLTPKDMNVPVDYQGMCTNVIIDGEVLNHRLEMIHLDRKWLITELAKQNIKNYADILLAYVDNAGTLVVHQKNIQPQFNQI